MKCDVQSECWTVQEVAEYLNVDRKTVLESFRSGELPGLRLGKKIIRFHKETVISLVKGQRCDVHSSGGNG